MLMKISYNKATESICITDGLKNQYFILKLLAALNVLNAGINLYRANDQDLGGKEYFWIGIGGVSLILLFYFIFKLSTTSTIAVKEIKAVNKRKVFGKNRYDIVLKNGRKRILGNFRTEEEMAEFHRIMADLKILPLP